MFPFPLKKKGRISILASSGQFLIGNVSEVQFLMKLAAMSVSVSRKSRGIRRISYIFYPRLWIRKIEYIHKILSHKIWITVSIGRSQHAMASHQLSTAETSFLDKSETVVKTAYTSMKVYDITP